MDRRLKSNTSKTRAHSLFRQGFMLYELIPTMPEHRLASPRLSRPSHRHLIGQENSAGYSLRRNEGVVEGPMMNVWIYRLDEYGLV